MVLLNLRSTDLNREWVSSDGSFNDLSQIGQL